MRVIIDELAVADIDGLAAWIANDSPKSARETVGKIASSLFRMGDLTVAA